MLEEIYTDTKEHFRIKSLVECKLTNNTNKIASPPEVSNAIASHAVDYASGNKAITFDLVHKQLINSLRARLHGKLIPADIKASLVLVERLNANIIANYRPARPLQQLLYIFTLAWFQASVFSSKEAIKNNCSVYEIINLIIKLCRRIDQYTGELARKLCHRLFKLFLDFASDEQDIESLNYLKQDVMKIHDDFLEERKQNIFKNINELRTFQKHEVAKNVIASKIRETIGDGIYPIVLLDFVENYITLFLENYFIKNGPKGKVWRDTLRDLSYLIWAFRAEVDAKYRKYFPKKIPPAMERLLTKVEPFLDEHETLYRDFIGIEEILKSREWGFYIKLESVFNAPYFSSESLFEDKTDTWFRSRSDRSDWFLILYKNKEIICQLLSKDIIKKKVVFVDYSGRIIMVYNTGEPGFDLNSIQAIPLRAFDDWEYLVSNVAYEIDNLSSDFSIEYATVLSEIDEELAEKMRQKKKEELELELRNKRIRAQIIKEREDRKKQRIKAKAYEEKRLMEESIRRDKCQLEVDKIKIGAVIYAKLDNNVVANLKLNIITRTTKRYIFNDRNCQHKLAVTREELVELLVKDSVRIMEFGRGEEYHQTLANVIVAHRNARQSNR